MSLNHHTFAVRSARDRDGRHVERNVDAGSELDEPHFNHRYRHSGGKWRANVGHHDVRDLNSWKEEH